MEKVRPWCGQPSDRGRLKNRTEQNSVGVEATGCEQLAQSRYAAAPGPGIELATSLGRKSDTQPLRHHATCALGVGTSM